VTPLKIAVALLVCALAACSNTTPAPVDSGAAPARKAAPPACAAGTFANNEGQCIKECATDADCKEAEHCEDVRFVEENGSLGPLMGKGCQ